MKRWIYLLVCLFASAAAWAQTLNLLPPSELGWRRLDLGSMPDKVVILQASTNLSDWGVMSVTHDGLFGYGDPLSVALQNRFYRASIRPKTAQDDFKNQVFQRLDPFLSEPSFSGGDVIQNEIRWIKFVIMTNEPGRVYFQDAARYPFHYPFAAARLPLFQGMSRTEFDTRTLHSDGQMAVLGAILFPPESQVRECGIQFAGLDAYAPEKIIEWIQWVKASMAVDPPLSFFYMPSSEQTASAQANAKYLGSNGVAVASVERWGGVNPAYSEGWAIGRLVFVTASEINAAYADGRLKASDILLTDTVPAETPYVAGLITLSPSTPNSHVAILSRSFGTPFAYIAGSEEQERIRGLVGGEIGLRVASGMEGGVLVFALSPTIDPALKSEILALKQTARLDITPKTRLGAYATNTEALYPSDIRYFGGKAANYGLLRRTIPDNSQAAVAFSFDLWDDFMSQTVAGGTTLKAEIKSRLDKYIYPPDIAALKTDLAAVRELIEKTTDFTPALRQAVTNALAVFDAGKKIRIRSSTNVEDSEAFTGAGLYDSYSGCLLDDLDADTGGPCQCDAMEPKERGVLRAIRKVYASFYNDNAFMERLRLRVDEEKAGMALLAHYSFPDEIELANGVATLKKSRDSQQMELVTQTGAFSVTNPDGNSSPEVVSAAYYSFGGPFLTLEAPSSLAPLGGKVMDWESDYTNLCRLIQKVGAGYGNIFPAKSAYMLDMEFKKVAPASLVIKQVRPLPSPAISNTTPVLLSQPVVYAVLQGERGDALSKHRLKGRLVLSSKNVRLDASALNRSIWDNLEYEYVENGEIKTLIGAPSSFATPSHQYESNASYTTLTDGWELGDGGERRSMLLRAEISDARLKNAEQPIVTEADFQLSLEAFYSTPKPVPFDADGIGGPGLEAGNTVTNESVTLTAWPVRTPTSLAQHRSIACPGGIQIETSFYWPRPPRGATAGYTAPLVEWVETRITGIGEEAIVLRGYYSQTYSPFHHNFAETFVFEPRLEPGIAPSILNALAKADIRLLVVHVSMGGATADTTSIQGLDGTFRTLKTK